MALAVSTVSLCGMLVYPIDSRISMFESEVSVDVTSLSLEAFANYKNKELNLDFKYFLKLSHI